MLYCQKCGSPIEVQDKFCRKCGTAVVSQLSSNENAVVSRFNIPTKPLTNLLFGIFLGAGAAMILVGLLIAFWLNSFYWGQYNFAISQGLQPFAAHSLLRNIAMVISLSSFVAMMGIYLLLYSVPFELSSTVRSAMERKDARTRSGNGLISGGFVLASLSGQNLVRQMYSSSNSAWYGTAASIMVIIGLSLILVGALLIRSSFLKSQKAADESLKSKVASP